MYGASSSCYNLLYMQYYSNQKGYCEGFESQEDLPLRCTSPVKGFVDTTAGACCCCCCGWCAGERRRGSCTPMTTAVWLLTLDWTAVVVSTSKSKWAVCWRVGDPADCTCLKPAAGKRSWLTVAKLPGLPVDPPEERREGKLWCVFGRCWFTVDDNLMPSLGISVSDGE